MYAEQDMDMHSEMVLKANENKVQLLDLFRNWETALFFFHNTDSRQVSPRKYTMELLGTPYFVSTGLYGLELYCIRDYADNAVFLITGISGGDTIRYEQVGQANGREVTLFDGSRMVLPTLDQFFAGALAVYSPAKSIQKAKALCKSVSRNGQKITRVPRSGGGKVVYKA